MKSPLVMCSTVALTALFALLVPALAPAQDTTPPVVLNLIPHVVVPQGTAHSFVGLDNVFGLSGVDDQVVRFSTSLGDMDVVLDSTDAPLNVANFLSYADFGSYDGSFLHRSVQGDGLNIIQGGGFYVVDDQVSAIATDPPVVNEFAVSNTRGTIAMAKTSDPDSATSQWFFNNEDNSINLDNPANSGGFTVFGRVIGDGLAVLDALAVLQIADAGRPLDELPVLDSYVGGNIQFSDLVYVNQVARIPMIRSVPGETALLQLRVAGNTNPDLVTATLNVNRIRLVYNPGVTGSATITVSATDHAGSRVRTKFRVTVR